MKVKTCEICGREFVRTPNGGVHKYCSAQCQRKGWEQNYPNRHRLIRIKARALEKNLEFDLTEEDLVIPEVCPVLKIPIDSPSVDRINPSKGYTKDNIRVISNRANTLKSNATIEELELILADARKLKWEQSMDLLTSRSGTRC